MKIEDVVITDFAGLANVVSHNAYVSNKIGSRLNTTVAWCAIGAIGGGYLLYQQNKKIKKLEKEVNRLKRDQENFEKG